MRLCLFLLLVAPMLPGNEIKPPDFQRTVPAESSHVCSIPLLEPPAFHKSHHYPRRFDRFAIPSPPSLDRNQIPPPAPPCNLQRETIQLKVLPKPPAPRVPK